ncbi:MAG: type II secretion system protein N [Desulfobacterales bacterium]|jgi:general secretion pathway protein C
MTTISFLSVDTAYKIIADQINIVNWHQPSSSRNNQDPPEFNKPPLSKYKAIVERNIFQTRTNTIAPAEKIVVENIKPTEKNLKLWGTVVGNDPLRAYAIIEKPSIKRRRSSQSLYRHGDTVEGATIKKILREKIILSVNGENEILHIVEPQGRGKFRRASNVSRQSRNRPIRQRRMLRSAQIQKAINNIDTLMSQANIRPHAEGFQISQIKRSSIFRKMGLRNGDVITAADSRPIKTVSDALDIWRNLAGRKKTSLEIKRRGRTRIIDYNIR